MTISERDCTSLPGCPAVSQVIVERAETIVARRYRLLEQLGRGGMGVVWRARDERLERDVALKVLHPWVAEDPELRERFEREASALARLEHPNVVRLYDVLENDGQTVLVMELVEGVGARHADRADARSTGTTPGATAGPSRPPWPTPTGGESSTAT